QVERVRERHAVRRAVAAGVRVLGAGGPGVVAGGHVDAQNAVRVDVGQVHGVSLAVNPSAGQRVGDGGDLAALDRGVGGGHRDAGAGLYLRVVDALHHGAHLVGARCQCDLGLPCVEAVAAGGGCAVDADLQHVLAVGRA